MNTELTEEQKFTLRRLAKPVTWGCTEPGALDIQVTLDEDDDLAKFLSDQFDLSRDARHGNFVGLSPTSVKLLDAARYFRLYTFKCEVFCIQTCDSSPGKQTFMIQPEPTVFQDHRDLPEFRRMELSEDGTQWVKPEPRPVYPRLPEELDRLWRQHINGGINFGGLGGGPKIRFSYDSGIIPGETEGHALANWLSQNVITKDIKSGTPFWAGGVLNKLTAIETDPSWRAEEMRPRNTLNVDAFSREMEHWHATKGISLEIETVVQKGVDWESHTPVE